MSDTYIGTTKLVSEYIWINIYKYGENRRFAADESQQSN